MLLTLAAAVGMFSCGHGKEGHTPDEPAIVEEPALYGSFDSKWHRYQPMESHPGRDDESAIVKEWNDTLWRGDRSHRQLVLWTRDKPVRGLEVKVSNLEGTSGVIPSSCVTLRYPAYVTGDAKSSVCGGAASRHSVQIADALSDIPVTGVTASEPLKIWLTADIPAETSPGRYSGSIDVVKDGEVLDSFGLSFLVTRHQLPAPSQWNFHLDIWQFPFQITSLVKKSGQEIEPFSEDYYELVRPFYERLADAGQKSVTAYIKDGAFRTGQTMVDWTLDVDGSWNFDYSKFDSYVNFMASLGISGQINCFSLAGWDSGIGYVDLEDNGYKRLVLDVGDPRHTRLWTEFLMSFESHLNEKGWFDKTVLYFDEVNEQDLAAMTDLIASVNPAWKTGSAGIWYPADLVSSLYEYSPIISCTEPGEPQRLTFYTSCSQLHPNNYVTSENSPAEMSYIAWYALANGYDGYTRWAFDYWINPDPLNAQDGCNAAGDNHFIYRSSNEYSSCRPLSSIRLEMLREGIQDYEKAVSLGRASFSDVLARFKYDGTRTDMEGPVSRGESLIKTLSAQ